MIVRKQWKGFIITSPDRGNYIMGVFPYEKINSRVGVTVSKKLFTIYRGVALYFI